MREEGLVKCAPQEPPPSLLEEKEEELQETFRNCLVLNETNNSAWRKRTESELVILSVTRLRALLKTLRDVVEDVSSELVKLLQEKDGLEEEVDIRNIAIEQLLKMQSKRLATTVQMSVGLPRDHDEDEEGEEFD